MVAIIDFGGGNLRSVQKAFEFIGFEASVTSDENVIKKADRVVFPGNGAFGGCMAGLRHLNLISAIDDFIKTERPFLGICIGMQSLFEKSFEFGVHEGFGYMKGNIRRFPNSLLENGMKIPHTGWNSVRHDENNPLFKDIPQNSYFYFVHSYYAPITNEKNIAGVTEYGVEFISAVSENNIFGVQFHPEKSQKAGLKLLENFCRL